MRVLYRSWYSVVLIAGLLGVLFASSCKNTVTGPPDSGASTLPYVVVTPRFTFINVPTRFTAVAYNLDTVYKHYIWYFTNPTDTEYSLGTAVQTFQRPGTYPYYVQVYDVVKGLIHPLFRDTGSIIVYSFSSSIAPSLLEGSLHTPYKFTVTPDSVLSGTDYKYVWTFGDTTKPITVKNSDTVNVTFAASGIYPIDVKIYDNLLGLVSEAIGVASINTTFQGLTLTPRVTLTNRSVGCKLWHPSLPSGQSHSDSWDFGDGSSATSGLNVDSVSHSYARGGRYIVRGFVYDNATNSLVFSGTDTVFVSSVDASGMSLSPLTVTGQPGQTFLFTVNHPPLDPTHKYHWIWNSGGTPSQAIVAEGIDTQSIRFDWAGADSVVVSLVDETLLTAIGESEARVQVSLPSNFDKSSLAAMTSVRVEFIGAHSYQVQGESTPGNDLYFTGSDSVLIGAHTMNDTVSYSKSSSIISQGYDTADFRDYYSAESMSSSVKIVLSADGRTCVYGSGGFSSSSYQSITDRMRMSTNVQRKSSQSSLTMRNLPLISFSNDIVQFGARGVSAKSNLDSANYSDWYSDNGPLTSSCQYTGTDWNSTETIPEILITFRK